MDGAGVGGEKNEQQASIFILRIIEEIYGKKEKTIFPTSITSNLANPFTPFLK